MTGDGDDVVEVPPNLHALFAARLDQLDTSERRVLERGAVEGELFHLGSVATLTPEEPNVTGHLASLVRRALVRPDRPQLPGEDGFRFRHLLIRDAAYDSLPKVRPRRPARALRRVARRPRCRARGAGRDRRLPPRAGRAATTPSSGTPDDALAHRASERLASAGTRAHNRSDIPAALNLYARALALRPDDPAVLLRLQLGTALRLTGGAGLSSTSLLEVADVAAAAGDYAGELVLRVAATSSKLLSGGVDEAAVRALAHEALDALRRHETTTSAWPSPASCSPSSSTTASAPSPG